MCFSSNGRGQAALSPLHRAAKRSQWYTVQHSQSPLPRLLVTIHLGSLGKCLSSLPWPWGKRLAGVPSPKPWHLCRERKKEPALPWAKTVSRYQFAKARPTPLTSSKTLKHRAKPYPRSALHGEINVSILLVAVRHLVMCFGSLKWHVK